MDRQSGFSMHAHPGATTKIGPQDPHRPRAECNASRRRPAILPTEVNKNGASTAFDGWAAVPIRINHKVIEMILPPHFFVAGAAGSAHGLVIAWRIDVIAPAIIAANGRCPQSIGTEMMAVSPPKGLQKPPLPCGRGAIAFAFIARDPAAAQAYAKAERASHQPTLLPLERIGKNIDACETLTEHGVSVRPYRSGACRFTPLRFR